MNDKRWVQHISGQGKKWEVYGPNCSSKCWAVNLDDARDNCAYLPRSEYPLCDPPEEWEAVTDECEVVDNHLKVIACKGETILGRGKYRLRKIQLREEISYQGQYAFIVERRKL